MSEILTMEAAARTPADPIREIEKLRAANRRWRKAAIGAVVAFIFLFVVSLVQFLGTFITCRLLHEARQEAARNRQDTMKALVEIKEAEKELRQTRGDVAQYVDNEKAKIEEREEAMRLFLIEVELRKLEDRGPITFLNQATPSEGEKGAERAREAYQKRKAELIAARAELEAKARRRVQQLSEEFYRRQSARE